MFLNELKAAEGRVRVRRRLGRGIGSGLGKTCGKGHKGQKARAGGYTKVGFEGGQMPLQRRLPKVGFTSHRPPSVVIPVKLLKNFDTSCIDVAFLRSVGLVRGKVVKIRIIGREDIDRAFTVKGINLSAGARQSILNAGGQIED